MKIQRKVFREFAVLFRVLLNGSKYHWLAQSGGNKAKTFSVDGQPNIEDVITRYFDASNLEVDAIEYDICMINANTVMPSFVLLYIVG